MSMVSDAQVSEASALLEVTVIQELFDGGQKRVLLANGTAGRVVLKVLTTSTIDPSAVERARREVELLATLTSPGLVKMESELRILTGPQPGAAWLEEYIPGTDLADLLVGPTWNWSETKSLMRGIARGLALTHHLGVVHRDLSPRNVRQRPDASWVVLDFGFARHTLRSGLTVGGHPGTLGFLSPEHVNGVAGGPMPSSDVFGIGILGYLTLTGRVPVQGTQDEEYLSRLVRCEIEPVGAVRGGLDDDAVRVLDRCLHPQPARRYPNAAALVRELENI